MSRSDSKMCVVINTDGYFQQVSHQEYTHTPAFGFTNLRVRYGYSWYDVLTCPKVGQELHILVEGDYLPVFTNFTVKQGFYHQRRSEV